MDRLEEIKMLVKETDWFSNDEAQWCIKEIERLREKCLHLEAIVEDRDGMIVQLQQALKEGE